MHATGTGWRAARAGFTLVEAVTATALVGMAGSALLLGVSSSLQTTNDTLDQAIASGMAQQLMDEIAGQPWFTPGGNPYASPLTATAAELSGPGRQQFSEMAAYNSLSNQPPLDEWGITLGMEDGQGGQRNVNFQAYPGFFSRWQRKVAVYYVSSSNFNQALPAGQTSDYRAAEVTISLTDSAGATRQLAFLRRVLTYVPIP